MQELIYYILHFWGKAIQVPFLSQNKISRALFVAAGRKLKSRIDLLQNTLTGYFFDCLFKPAFHVIPDIRHGNWFTA